MHHILVCDDEPHVVEGIRFLLRAAGRRIRVAANGREALERVEDEAPDLLITDIMMPEMDGLALVAALRGRAVTKRMPIIVLTAKAQIEDARLAQEMWGVTVIGKPFDPRSLKQLVASMLEDVTCQPSGST
jgi:CheY-like chemotaxis protein